MFETIPTEALEATLLISAIIAAAFIAELPKIYEAIVAFVVYIIIISGVFWLLGSPILSLYQLSVYGGTAGIILFGAISVFGTSPKETEIEALEEVA